MAIVRLHSIPPQLALFYSHDTLGLGHLRRTLSICQELSRCYRELSTLILTGSAMAQAFRLPSRVDYVKLPCVKKLGNESYESRYLEVPFQQILALREEIIFRTTTNYAPDLFFVDNVPLGMKGELQRTLHYIREHLPNTKVCLNLRDIVDSADHVIPLWSRLGMFDILDKYYDRIFIYGEPRVFDPLAEYGAPDPIRRKALFCGYIPRKADPGSARWLREMLTQGKEKLILVTVGGGSDGAMIIENYLRALPLVSTAFPVASVVITGPEMNPTQVDRFKSQRRGLPVRFMEFTDESLNYMDAADLVISMGGYNTVSEILALGKRAIVIPRVHPRKEQLIRSQRLQELGRLRMIHPDNLTPLNLAREIYSLSLAKDPGTERALDFGAFRRLGAELRHILEPCKRQAS